MMSSEQLFSRLQAHADMKPGRQGSYQRNSRGPNAAPAKVHSTILPPYQTGMMGARDFSLRRLNLYAIDLQTRLRHRCCYGLGSAVLGIGAFGRLSSFFDQDL